MFLCYLYMNHTIFLYKEMSTHFPDFQNGFKMQSLTTIDVFLNQKTWFANVFSDSKYFHFPFLMVSVRIQVLNFDEIYFISPLSLTLVVCLRKCCLVQGHKNFTPRINSFSRRFVSSFDSGLRSILSYTFLWVRYQFNIVPLPDNIKVSQYHSLKIFLFSECAGTLVGNQVTIITNVDF